MQEEVPGSRCAAGGCAVKAAPPPSARSPGDCKAQRVVNDTVTGGSGGEGWGAGRGMGLPNKVDGLLAGGENVLIDGPQHRLPSVGFVLHQDDEEESVENPLQGLNGGGAFQFHDFI